MQRVSQKSQVTIFIVLAVCLLAGAGLFLFFLDKEKNENLDREEFSARGIQPSITNIQTFISDCLKETTLSGLELVGIQGGYYQKPERHYDLSNLNGALIPYYYDQGFYQNPSKQTVETQLSLYIDDALPFCLKKIDFKNFELTSPVSKTKTIIEEGKITITTTLPLTIKNEDKTTDFKLQDHPLTLESELNDILTVADYITQSHTEDDTYICINCLTQLTKEKNLYVDFIAFAPDTTLVMLIENSTQPDPYIFQFLNRYKVEEDKNEI